MKGILIQLSISPGGMPKLPIPEGRVTKDGVEGDWQKNRKYHGGPDRAICLFSEELYQWLADEHGIELKSGSVGENFTTRGIDLLSLKPGDQLRAGDCVIEITDVRIPCRNLNQWDPKLLKVIKGRSGWVAKVLEEAIVSPGDVITLLSSNVMSER